MPSRRVRDGVRRRRRRRTSLRLRITAGSLVVVIAGLCGAGLLLIGLIEREMTHQIDTTLVANADFVIRSLRSGENLPTGEGPTDLYVQFVSRDGQVLGASTAATGLPALARPGSAESQRIVTADAGVLGEVRVLTRAAPVTPDVSVVVARSASSVSNVRDLLVRVLIVIVVAGSALLGGLVWIVVGRALRPVDGCAGRSSAISARDLHRRVEAPGTGDELERLAETLNELLERLDVAVNRERQFVADASHELRTPLAACARCSRRSRSIRLPSSTHEPTPWHASATSRTSSTSCWCWHGRTTASAMYRRVRSISTSSC